MAAALPPSVDAVAAATAAAGRFDGLEYAENYSRFLVLGGGVAGLSAASHLARCGVHDFKLLEARNRLGGRVISVGIGTSKAELGASWIHGVLGNPLYELAVSQGLVDVVQTPKPHNVAAVTEDGRRLPFNVLQEVYEAYFWFFKRCEEYFLCKYQPPQGIASVGQHIELEIGIYLQRYPPQHRHVRRLVFDYLLKRECCITGCDSMEHVDLLGVGSYTELPGGNITIPTGYSSIIVPILASIPDGNVLKQHPVRQIHWKYRTEMENLKNDKGYESEEGEEEGNGSDSSAKTVKSAAQSVASSAQSSRSASVCATPLHRRLHPNVMVECENGVKFYADHVICTIPLGVIKESAETLFAPSLPADKRAAIEMLHFGTVNKIYLEYERPFLSPDVDEIVLLWDRMERESEVPMKERWFRKIYSFAKQSDTLLIGWISGEEARFMETLKMNVVAETCTALIKKFLADPYVPKPKSCVFTAWHSQPYSRGSYTSIGVGGQQSHIEKMAEPLFQKPMNRTPVVAFAGEHCHPSFYSTVHGAYLSGRSAAQFMLNAAAKSKEADDDEDVYNLGAASVADLSTWLQEVSMGEKSLEDYKSGKKERGSRDDGKYTTPR